MIHTFFYSIGNKSNFDYYNMTKVSAKKDFGQLKSKTKRDELLYD